MKKIISSFILIICAFTVQAQVTLATGDLALIGINADGADNDDEFVLLTLAEIQSGSVIFFTDNGWDNVSNDFFGSEETITFTVGETSIPAGTILRSSQFNSYGSASATFLDTYNASGDQLLIYQTDDGLSSGNPTLIYAFNSNIDNTPVPHTNGWSNDNPASTSTTTNLPAGLTAVTASGDNASAFNFAAICNANVEVDNLYFTTASYVGTKATVLQSIHTCSNWTVDDTNEQDLTGDTNDVFILAGAATASTHHFRSRVAGNWTNPANWESSSDGITWIPASLFPTNQASSIQINHAIDVTSDETAHNLKVAINGGQLRVRIGNRLRIRY